MYSPISLMPLSRLALGRMPGSGCLPFPVRMPFTGGENMPRAELLNEKPMLSGMSAPAFLAIWADRMISLLRKSG